MHIMIDCNINFLEMILICFCFISIFFSLALIPSGLQPVHLFVLMKPGKGKHLVESENNLIVDSDLQQHQKEEVDLTVLSSLDSRSLTPDAPADFRRPRTLSINGERVVGLLGPRSSDIETAQDVDWSLVNIHDYAKFEQEKYLMPDFRNSIKKLEGEENSGIIENISKQSGMTRKRSFKEMASKVRTMEKVLKLWPRRPRSRHHSSSSEDYSQSESDTGSKGKASGRALFEVETDRASETTSIDTVSVDFSPSRSPLNEGWHSKVVQSESNNNEETCVLQDVGKNDMPTDIKKEIDSSDAKDIMAKDMGLLVISGEERGKKGNGLVITDCGHRVDIGESGGCTTPSQAAAVISDSVGVSCTGVVDVVSPMHEEPGPVVVPELPQGGTQRPVAEGEKIKKEEGVGKTYSQPPVQSETGPSSTPSAAVTSASTSCCGNCRCVVL